MSDTPGDNFRPRNTRGGRPRQRNQRRPRQDDRRDPHRNDRHDTRRDDRRGDRRPPGREDDRRGPRPERRAPAPPAKPSLGQRLITLLTFGLIRPKPASAKSRPPRSEPPPKARQENDPAGKTREARQHTPIPAANLTDFDTDRLHIGNLSYDASETDLMNLFNGIGKVQSVDIVYNNKTHRSKGFAFVQMMGVNEARRAVEELHGKPFMGRPLHLGPARTRGRDDREAKDTDD